MRIFKLLLVFSIAFSISCREKTKAPKLKSESTLDIKTQDSSYVKDYTKLGFKLMDDDCIGPIKLGLSKSDLESKIGVTNEMSEPELSQADGSFHQILRYINLGLEIDLIQKPDSSFSVDMIIVIPPCEYETSKRIHINSTLEEVKQAYKDYIDLNSSTNDVLVAGSIYGGVVFKLENKIVNSIIFGAMAE